MKEDKQEKKTEADRQSWPVVQLHNGIVMPLSVSPEAAGRAVLASKMAAIMGDLGRIRKLGENRHHGYAYVQASDVKDAVRELLAKYNVAFVASVAERHREGSMTHVVWTVQYVCGDTGAVFSSRWDSEAMDSQDKGINKAATAGPGKYLHLTQFLISTGDEVDPDADDRSDARSRGRAERAAAESTARSAERRGGSQRTAKAEAAEAQQTSSSKAEAVQQPSAPKTPPNDLAEMRSIVESLGQDWDAYSDWVLEKLEGTPIDALTPQQVSYLKGGLYRVQQQKSATPIMAPDKPPRSPEAAAGRAAIRGG